MKSVFAILACLVVAPSAQSQVPIEPEHRDRVELSPSHADLVAGIVHLEGYPCDSITALRRWEGGSGFTLHCNGYRYEYDIDLRNGRVTVTAKAIGFKRASAAPS